VLLPLTECRDGCPDNALTPLASWNDLCDRGRVLLEGENCEYGVWEDLGEPESRIEYGKPEKEY
jgi:hypothetical protein